MKDQRKLRNSFYKFYVEYYRENTTKKNNITNFGINVLLNIVGSNVLTVLRAAVYRYK